MGVNSVCVYIPESNVGALFFCLLCKSNKPVLLLLSLKTDIGIIRLIPKLWETYDFMIKGRSQMREVIVIAPLASQKTKSVIKIVNFEDRKILLLLKRAFY